ncbi:hypothetical protein QTN47_13820 [Danxiaibacter flavus]|uniref:DUF4595 domain-containing protein n=1 Tax=Danxiaibacter flavus TaxID=3049108 RepID=A0ABV3ZFD3_9BACT|nr:hypothetical protein QNM32_13825 [Chitinophagaceae bacterium DXS]
MNPRSLRYLLPVLLLIGFASCKKIIEHGSDDETCSDCSALYSSEKKIKSIQVKDSDIVTNQYFLFYTNGLLDSISHEQLTGKTLAYDYSIKVLYSENSCIPSGYKYLTDNSYERPTVDASFLVDSNVIVRKSIYRPISGYYSGDSSSTFGYDYYPNGLLKTRDFHYLGDQFPEIQTTTDYSTDKNISAVTVIGDYTMQIRLSEFDAKANPFSFQNNILYYLSVQPYNVFPNRYEVMGNGKFYPQYFPFDNVTLSRNNLGLLVYDNNYVYYDEYTFKYTYNADGYANNITIFTNIRNNEDVNNYKKAEEINLTYY